MTTNVSAYGPRLTKHINLAKLLGMPLLTREWPIPDDVSSDTENYYEEHNESARKANDLICGCG